MARFSITRQCRFTKVGRSYESMAAMLAEVEMMPTGPRPIINNPIVLRRIHSTRNKIRRQLRSRWSNQLT